MTPCTGDSVSEIVYACIYIFNIPKNYIGGAHASDASDSGIRVTP